MQAPAGDQIHVWCMRDEDTVASACKDLLSQDELVRMARLRAPSMQHQFLVTRVSVRTLLSAYFPSVSARDWSFERNLWGRPIISNQEARGRVSFNIAHTDGRIVIAVSGSGEVGVDIERVTRKVRAVALAERYFSGTEAAALRSLPNALHRQRFFELWTLKEAYIKACGIGLAIPLQSFSFALDESQIGIAFAPQRQDDPSRWQFWQLLSSDGYLVGLALAGGLTQNISVQCRSWLNLEAGDWPDMHVLRRSLLV